MNPPLSSSSSNKKVNTIFSSTLDNQDRFCTHCHVKLYPHNNEKYVFKCPTCGIVVNIHNTEPTERLQTTFASNSPDIQANRNFVYQNKNDRLPRHLAFQQQRAAERNTIEDPYLKELRKRSDITITSTESYLPGEYI